MLKTELSDAVTELKVPERKINMIAALIIVSVLWAILVLVVKSWGQNLLEENRYLKTENSKIAASKQREIDSIKLVQYNDVVEQLQNIKKLERYQDSLNRALRLIKHELR